MSLFARRVYLPWRASRLRRGHSLRSRIPSKRSSPNSLRSDLLKEHREIGEAERCAHIVVRPQQLCSGSHPIQALLTESQVLPSYFGMAGMFNSLGLSPAIADPERIFS